MYLTSWTPRLIYSFTAHHGSAILGRHSRPNTGLHTTAPACCAGGARRDLQLRTQLCTAAIVRDLSSADPGAALAGWAGAAAGCSPLPQASGASPHMAMTGVLAAMAAVAKEATAVAAEAVATAAAMAVMAVEVIWKRSAAYLRHIHAARVSHVHMAGTGLARCKCMCRACACGLTCCRAVAQVDPRLPSHGEMRRHSPGGVPAHFPGRCAASLELDVHPEGSERVVRSPSTPSMISDHHASHDSTISCYGPPANV